MRNHAGFLGSSLILAALAGGMRAAGEPGPSEPVMQTPPKVVDEAALARRFQREIWPMIASPDEAGKGCFGCHSDDGYNTSRLVFSGHSADDFRMLLADGYFDGKKSSAILARIAHDKPRDRMPPEPLPSWSKSEIARLRKFVEAVGSSRER